MAVDPRAFSQTLMGYDDVITLVVGSSEDKLLVHRVRMERSAFFKTALKKEWHSKQSEIRLPEDETTTVRTYVHYLYTGTIAVKAAFGTAEDGIAHNVENQLLAKLYTLGEKYQDTTFRNRIIDAIIAKSGCREKNIWASRFFNCGAISIIYRGTCAGSPARSLLVDMYAQHGNKTWLPEEEDGSGHPDFLLDLSRKLYMVVRGCPVKV